MKKNVGCIFYSIIRSTVAMNKIYPVVKIDKEKDTLEVEVKYTDAPRFVEPINSFLNLWRDHQTDEVYGFEILHFKELMEIMEKTEKINEELTPEEEEKIYKSLKEMGFEKFIEKDESEDE